MNVARETVPVSISAYDTHTVKSDVVMCNILFSSSIISVYGSISTSSNGLLAGMSTLTESIHYLWRGEKQKKKKKKKKNILSRNSGAMCLVRSLIVCMGVGCGGRNVEMGGMVGTFII